MSKNANHPENTADEALRILEESLAYFTPTPMVTKSAGRAYEDLPLAS